MTIPIFAKLFQIKVVASRRSESVSNFCIILLGEESLSSIPFLSAGLNEKKAISDAETMAERHKSKSEMTSAIIELIEIVVN